MKKLFYSVCVILVLIGMIVGDLPLKKTMGTITGSPMIFISIFILLLLVISNNMKLVLSDISKYFLIYWLISFAIGALLLIYFVFQNATVHTQWGHNLLIKLINASMYNFIYFSAYVVMYISIQKSKINISKLTTYLFLIIMIILFIENFNSDLFNLFHSTFPDDKRLRLLTPESSQAIVLMTIIALMTVALSNSTLTTIIVLFFYIVSSLMILSKGGLIFIALSALIVFFFQTSWKSKIKLLPLILVFSIFMFYILVEKVIPMLVGDIENFSSFSTRASSLLAMLQSLFYYPLGEGYATYMIYLPPLLLDSLYHLENFLNIPLNGKEIIAMSSTGENLGIKSGIGFQIVQNGLIAVFFYIVLFKKSFQNINSSYLNNNQKFIFKILLVYLLLTMLFGANIETLYIILLPIVILEIIAKKSKIIQVMENK